MSTKYRLIKKYPGSPKLGTKGEVINKTVMYTEIDNDVSYYSTVYIDFKKYPEFWKEIVEKDYEILSFKQDSLCEDLWTEFNHGWCRNSNGQAVTLPYSYEGILNNHSNGGIKYHIHSVKRISDGEIFTVGDKVRLIFNKASIVVVKTINKIALEKIGCQPEKLYIYTEGGRFTINKSTINNYAKVKQPLFTTEDSVDIYEGDEYFELALTFEPQFREAIYERIGNRSNINYDYNTLKGKKKLNEVERYYFSTKEAAGEYVLMNKPCLLSINDILNITYNPLETKYSATEKLKKLVKSKL